MDKVNIPTEGNAGGWVLADGPDVQRLTITNDGTLNAYVKDLTYTLYKSTDGGSSWSSIGNVQDNIVGADVYELLVSTDANFSNHSIIDKDDCALSFTACQCDLSRNHDTT